MPKRKKSIRRRRSPVAELFEVRRKRFLSECGWCAQSIAEDDPVVAVGGRTHEDLDLSLVQGKVIEVRFEAAEKTILCAVAAFDSEAKAEGKDILVMTCSNECGSQIRDAFAQELARGFSVL
jgi:hypothetical protein